MEITIKEISSLSDLGGFIRFPDQLYKKCRYYVPAIHRDQRSVLSKENPALLHCEARYWLAYSHGKIAGRVAAIVNHRYNEERGTKYLRFGWLDFIEDEKVPELLLNASEDWAREKNIEFIHGPLGFTSFDPSGVLVEGFDEWPTAWGRYNYPYYDRMLTRLGYTKHVDWIEKTIRVPDGNMQRENKVARLVRERYSLRNADIRTRRDIRKYMGQVFEIINSVYTGLYGFSTLSRQQVNDLAEKFLPMTDPRCISVILNQSDKVVAFGIVMPSLSRALKRAGGKLYPFGLLHILWSLRFNDTADMLLIGVRPEYQKRGAHALIFEKIIRSLQSMGIRQVETTRELEDNEKVQQLWNGYDVRQHKRARCYIKRLG